MPYDPSADGRGSTPHQRRHRPEESTPGNRASEVVDQIRASFTDKLAGIYTFYPVTVDAYDTETQRVSLSFLDQPEVTLGGVPITTPSAGPGSGEFYPIEPGKTRGYAGFS